MNLILHILLKDLRRHKWEIALYCAVVLGWALQELYPSDWITTHSAELLPILLFLVAIFLIIRVTQGESLVGDREFWTTRPYRWHQLALAKLLFCLLTLNLPLFIAQLCLLLTAGFPLNFSTLSGLIVLNLECLLMITLPTLTLATITKSIVQWVIGVVLILLFVLSMAWVPFGNLPTTLQGAEDLAGGIAVPLLALLLVAIILLQYTRRTLLLSRTLFLCALPVIPLFVWFSSTNIVRNWAYSSHPTNTRLSFSYAEVENGAGKGQSYDLPALPMQHFYRLNFKINAQGLTPESLIVTDGYRITVNQSNNHFWNSDWEKDSQTFIAESPEGHFTFDIPEDVLKLLQSGKATISVEVAAKEYKLAEPVKITDTKDKFSIPGNAICDFNSKHNWHGLMLRHSSECLAPPYSADTIVAKITSDYYPCKEDSDQPSLPPGHFAYFYYWGVSKGMAEFGIKPVHEFSFYTSPWQPTLYTNDKPRQEINASQCPGTPLTVRQGTLQGHFILTNNLGLINIRIFDPEKHDNEGTIDFDFNLDPDE